MKASNMHCLLCNATSHLAHRTPQYTSLFVYTM